MAVVVVGLLKICVLVWLAHKRLKLPVVGVAQTADAKAKVMLNANFI